MKWLTDLASGLVSPITNLITKKNDNKTKVKLSQIDRLKNSDNALATWEEIQAENNKESWKDEWITLIITLPIPTVFISVVVSVLLDNPLYAQAANQGIDAISKLVPNYSELLYIVCLAGIGIRAFKK